MTLVLSSTSLAAFADQTRTAWANKSAQDLWETWQDHYTTLDVPVAALVPICETIDKYGARYDIRGERELFRLVLVASALGHRFWQDPRFHSYIATSVANAQLTPSRRAMAMAQNGKIWLRQFWQDDGLDRFALRLADALDAASGPDALRIVVPQHWHLFAQADNSRLIDWLLTTIPQTEFSTPPQKLAYLALALVHGAHWATDPQYRLLRSIVTASPDGADMAVKLSTLYKQLG